MNATMRKLAGWACGAALAAGVLPAQTSRIERDGGRWVQTEEGVAAAASRLEIRFVGPVTVTGEARRDFHYRIVKRLKAPDRKAAEELFADAPVRVSGQAGKTVLSLDAPPCFGCGFTAEAAIRAPSATEHVGVETRSGAVEVRGVDGSVTADTAGGAISMDKIGGEVRAATAGGGIELGQVGGPVHCETAGGGIRVKHSGGDATLITSGGSIEAETVKGDLQAETAGGGISIQEVEGRVLAVTSGGSIRLGRAGGPVSAETAGGSIEIESAPAGVDAEAAGGSIRLRDVAGALRAMSAAGGIEAHVLAGGRLADSLLETTAGNITVYLPDGVPVTIEASVDLAGNLNRIKTDFETLRVRRTGNDFGPGTVTASGSLHGGGPVLRLLNTSGRIQIRKREPVDSR